MSDRLLAELATPGAVVLIGELHGTNEFPRLVGRLVEVAAGQGLAVLVGLEVPRSEQPAIDAFLAGDGRPDDVEALTASPFWRREPKYDDGRAGLGLIELFTTARAAAAAAAVQVFGFDQPWAVEGTVASPEQAAIWSMPRDEFMAQTAAAAIEAWHASQAAPFTVLLAGNMHTRVVRYPGFSEPHLAELLVERFPHLVTLDGNWSGGHYRAAVSERGAEIQSAGACPTPPGAIGLHEEEGVRRSGHHGWVNVGKLTPSLPVGAS
ncbi:MAG: hypothetical protein R2761_06815 [Acidimicrobiales bacterium]